MRTLEVGPEASESDRQSIANGFRVLVVDADAASRESLAALVARRGFAVAEAGSIQEAGAQLADEPPDLMFVDLSLPDGNGHDLVSADAGMRPDFVVITDDPTVEAAVDALRRGALDFLTKPVDRSRLRVTLAGFVRAHILRSKVSILRGELRSLGRFGPMVGRSLSMQRVYDLIAKIAPTRASVLITGNSGTGKELVSETIHKMSPRAGGPFLAVNCGAVAPHVIESELFGHERGSFTGADRGRRGYFEEADGGTLLLDEITEMSADLQVKLLRVIETGRLFRVGASEPISVDVRVIASTNREPEKAILQSRLREDLYYRLDVFRIDVPPLRERGDDILMLADHFLREVNSREGVNRRWSERALRRLQTYAWPGNVRELRNIVERAALLSGDLIDDPCLPADGSPAHRLAGGSPMVFHVGSRLADVERRMILATLRMTGGDKRAAARRLGVCLKTLYNRLGVYEAAGQIESADRAAS